MGNTSEKATSSNHITTNSGRPKGPPPPPPPKKRVTCYVALYEYSSTGDNDIGLVPGDILISETDQQDNVDWLYVKHVKNNSEGYAPRNYLANRESLEKEPWYFGKLTRVEIEKMFNRPDIAEGVFLIREQIREVGEMALNVKFVDPQRQKSQDFRTYKIGKTEQNFYYLSPNIFYPSLSALVEAYQRDRKGICCKLTSPFPKIAQRLHDLSPKTQDNCEIPKTDLTFVQKLGEGNFGEVHLALWKNRTKIAVKCLKTNSDMSRDKFLEEAKIMKECRHENLVSYFGVCSVEEPICILTEYMINGNLLKYLRRHSTVVPYGELIDISGQVARGMSYLEQKRIVHRDLAARNVLVGEKIGSIARVRIADFGLAKIFNEEFTVYISQSGGKLPIKWTAPEALLRNVFSSKSDVWSFGILIYEIFSRGCSPYAEMNNTEVIRRLSEGYRLPLPKNCPEAIYNIMLTCWSDNPQDRYTFEYLHNYFEDLKFSSQPSYFQAQDD